MPRCKNCSDKFDSRYFNQKYCMLKNDCIKAHLDTIKEKQKKQRAKTWNKKAKAIKEKLKTSKDYKKEVQTVFNKFIRLRDQGQNCISCNKPCRKENAGHYRSVGSTPELRFEESNVYLQCEYCNTFLHGNLINYRINLIKKIGVEKVEWLEGPHELKRYTTAGLKELKEVYKQKIKEL